MHGRCGVRCWRVRCSRPAPATTPSHARSSRYEEPPSHKTTIHKLVLFPRTGCSPNLKQALRLSLHSSSSIEPVLPFFSPVFCPPVPHEPRALVRPHLQRGLPPRGEVRAPRHCPSHRREGPQGDPALWAPLVRRLPPLREVRTSNHHQPVLDFTPKHPPSPCNLLTLLPLTFSPLYKKNFTGWICRVVRSRCVRAACRAWSAHARPSPALCPPSPRSSSGRYAFSTFQTPFVRKLDLKLRSDWYGNWA